MENTTNKTCCFTGHRPNHLPWGEQEDSFAALTCKMRLAEEIERAWQEGYRHFLCGVAQGADLMFAEGVLACQMVHPDVKLIAAIPCSDQTNGWKKEQIARYQSILAAIGAENCILIQQEWTKGCMLRRDRYMVNQSQRIIALYNGTSRGGTKYTLGYAMQQGLDYVIIDPNDLTVQRKNDG